MPARRNVLMCLYAGVVLAGAGVLADAGDLNPPPGPVSPTMVTLDEIDGKLDQILSGLTSRVDASSGEHRGSPPFDIYMTADFLIGESDDPAHRDWLDIDSAVLGFSGPSVNPGMPPVPRTFNEIKITGTVDSALTALMHHQTDSDRLRRVIIEWCLDIGFASPCVLRIEMDECFVTKSMMTLKADGTPPAYVISLQPRGILEVTYTQLNKSGNPDRMITDTITIQ